MYLLTKNIKIKRLNKKLDYVKVGPFLINKQTGLVNYKLELLKDSRIHLVFHVLALELADPLTPLQTTFHLEPLEDNDHYELEGLVSFDGQKYLVKWAGYDELENT